MGKILVATMRCAFAKLESISCMVKVMLCSNLSSSSVSDRLRWTPEPEGGMIIVVGICMPPREFGLRYWDFRVEDALSAMKALGVFVDFWWGQLLVVATPAARTISHCLMRLSFPALLLAPLPAVELHL
jgi:hypothetical protein